MEDSSRGAVHRINQATTGSFMDPQRERIQADLRGLLSGEVFCDDRFTQMYASDASVYQMRPLGVVRPRGTADVRAEGKVISFGKRIATAEGRLVDSAGKLYAHGTTTCLILAL